MNLLERLKYKHGKPMTGTRWRVHLWRTGAGREPCTYSEAISKIRDEMIRTPEGESFTLSIVRDE